MATKKDVISGKPLPSQVFRRFTAGVLITGLVLAAGAFVWWYVDQVRTLSTATDRAQAQRDAKLKAMNTLTAKAAAKESPPKEFPPKEVQAQKSTPMFPVVDADPSHATAPATAQIDDLVVGVSAAQLGPLNQLTAGECLKLTLRVTNLSNRNLSYQGWSRPNSMATLRDQYRNYYNRVPLPSNPTEILPRQTITDTLVFEATPVNVTLELDLPYGGGDRAFHFRIPGGLVRRESATPTRVVQEVVPPRVVKEATPPPPAPYDPERDPQLMSAIIAAHREGLEKIERRALGMGFDRARKYRRTGREDLLKALAKKNNLSEDQVRRILGLQ